MDAIVEILADDARYSMPPLSHIFVGPGAIRDSLLAGPLRRPGMRWRLLPTSANGQLAFSKLTGITRTHYIARALLRLTCGTRSRVSSGPPSPLLERASV